MRVSARRRWRAVGIALAVAGLGAILVAQAVPAVRAARDDVRIAAAAPTTLDPAAQSDVDSAAVSAQLFETLTTFDTNLVLRPALAASWDVNADATQVVFHLRPGLTYSDGTPLSAADVVRSWLRIIDPGHPSPLASLMLDVKGAKAYLAGRSTDPSTVGLQANGNDVVVQLERSGNDFPSVVASPTFAVAPAFACGTDPTRLGQCGVSSGGYVLSAATDTELTLTANSHYWAGTPAIRTIHLLVDLGGRSPVDVYAANDVDDTPIASNDASWIRFDPTLGPDLRSVPSLSVTYLGFTTSKPPFNDPRVREAVAEAVDWSRVEALGAAPGDVPATSMVPIGIPGRDDRSFVPKHDAADARKLLAAAGYPGGAGFPDVALSGGPFDTAIAAELKAQLGITVRIEEYEDYFGRLATEPPAMWTLGWVADYPGQNDFLGVLLGTGASGNYGRWSSAGFDTATEQALGTRDPAAAQAAFDQALGIVQSDVPAIPLVYPGPGWSLTREGLLGAGVSAMGIPRFAGLSWAP